MSNLHPALQMIIIIFAIIGAIVTAIVAISALVEWIDDIRFQKKINESNERLLQVQKNEMDRLEKELLKLGSERDRAVQNLRHVIKNSKDGCKFCTNIFCFKRGGETRCNPSWRNFMYKDGDDDEKND